MEMHIKRYDVSAKMDFTRNGTISGRPLTEYLQFLHIVPKELEALHNKKILLIGGGQSPIREWLEGAGIETEVTNLDFFFDADDHVSHIHIREDFFMWAGQQDYYNEIWALHSLPLYMLSKEEAPLFFAKASLMLAPGGSLRVFPINDGNVDAIFDCHDFYSITEKGKDSHKSMMDIAKMGFSTKIIKNELVSIADQMLAAEIDTPYSWFFTKHQEDQWKNFASAHDLEKAKLRAYLFHIIAPLSKGRSNSELAAYIASKTPRNAKNESVRVG